MRAVLIALLLAPSAYPQTGPTYKTVVLEQGEFQFPLQPADKESEEQYCPEDKCTCEAEVNYVRLTVPGHATVAAAINDSLKKDAEKVRCSYLLAIETMNEEVTHLSARFASIREVAESLPTGGQGSCHEFSVVHTIDLVTGREYRLADVVDKSSVSELRSVFPASLVAHEREPSDPEREMKAATSAVASLSDENLLQQNLFIDRGRLFTDVEGYIFACFGGTLHPAEIPVSLITSPSIRQELANKSR